MNYISLCGLQKPLPFPYIVRNVVSADSEGNCFFRNPEIRQDIIAVILVKRRKDKDKCSYIRCT